MHHVKVEELFLPSSHPHTVGQNHVHATNTAEQVTIFFALLGLPLWPSVPSFSCVSVWGGDHNPWVQQG